MNKPSNLVQLTTPATHITRKTRGEIEAYIAGRGKTRVHQGARNLSLNISDDYGNRFLVELIQNAHDAHPLDRSDGEIAIVLLPEEGSYGCLYVANRGNGFDGDNFESITNIALSSKPVNESIGNKGLGFRSVLQICRWPEVYSVLPESMHQGMFDGYCFRFATESDLHLILTEMDEPTLCAEIWGNMPCWFLPVLATDRPGLVDRFARQGFATVVRMPLESEEARAAVVQQIEWLLALETPLHLFLDRIARITIELEPNKEQVLERRCLDVWSRSPNVEIQRLAIGSDEFLLASRDLEPEGFRHALDESLAKKQVPTSWADWIGAARVSIAIRLNRPVDKGLLYCFLPLGEEGRSPFSGFINANFYTKIDRRSVELTISLHRLFISSAADLCRHAIEFLIEQSWSESAGAVVDLLCWKGPYVRDIRQAFDRDEQTIVKREILPTWVAGSRVKWKAAAETFIWNTSAGSCLSAEAISEATGDAILLPSLSDKQKDALREFFRLVDESFQPSSETVANWVETVAQRMLDSNAPAESWGLFYDEVAEHLRTNPSVLFGKRFLLSASGDLIASYPSGEHGGRRRADIYFAPILTREAEGDRENDGALPIESMPASLKRGFAFLNTEIPWLKQDGYRPARTFLLEAKLVREYDTREVLRTLATITRGSLADSTKATALEWAFRLWSTGRPISDNETRSARFALPTKGGWRLSDETMFGVGWSTSNGKLLEKLLRQGADVSDELANARDCLLAAHDDWPVRYGTEEDWRRFLFAAGARDSLRPIGGKSRIQKDAPGHSLDTVIVNSADLDDETRAIWQRQLSSLSTRVRNPYTIYRYELHSWRFPGQGASLGFSDIFLRRDYANQILKAIPHLHKEHLSFRVFRPFHADRNEERWPTPLKAFITEASWIPVQRGGGEMKFAAPADAWLSSADFDPRPPRFVDLVSPFIARSSEDGLAWLHANVGLGLLDEPKDATRALRVYAQTARSGLTDDTDVRRFRELFSNAWNAAISEAAKIDLDWIPVRVADRIEALSGSKTDEEEATAAMAYFVDEDNDAKKQLLEEIEEFVFDFDVADVERSWQLLTKLAPGRFRRMSEQPLEVRVDGSSFEATEETPFLCDIFGHWITDFLVCAAEHKGGAFFTRSQKTLSRLKQMAETLRIALGRQVQISMDGNARNLPSSVRGGVVVRNGPTVVLVLEAKDGNATLDLLAGVSKQLAMALNQKTLANGFEAALLRLANLPLSEAEKPDDDDLATALGVDVEELEQTRRYAQLDLSSHVTLAQPLAAYLGLIESVGVLERMRANDDLTEENVLEGLKPISIALKITERQLVAHLGNVSDIRDLKESFDLDLLKLNEVLRNLGGRFQPINNKDLHCTQFRAHLTNHNTRIVERLRTAFVEQFDNFQDLSRYVYLRGAVETIEPDKDWFERYDELSEGVMEQRIEIWLLSQNVPAPGTTCKLPPLSECRETNGRALRDFSRIYGPVVSAWVRSFQEGLSDSVRDLWLDSETAKLGLIQRAQANGWIEFRLVDESQIVRWLEQAGHWPAGKPISASLTDWGIPDDAVTRAQEDTKHDREARRQERNEIAFAGQKVSALAADYQALMDVVTDHTSESMSFLDINASFRSLADLQESARGGGGSGGGFGGGSGSRKADESSMSDEQKKAIGFVGERWAFAWIKAFHQKRHNIVIDDNCWVSCNRNVVLGGMSGRDDLGYDFEVRLSSTIYYYEVKASSGNPQFFEMGPTEIGTALKHKADKDKKYRILYIAYATDPHRVEATILANPFSKEGQRKLRAIGRRSVKYEFSLKGTV